MPGSETIEAACFGCLAQQPQLPERRTVSDDCVSDDGETRCSLEEELCCYTLCLSEDREKEVLCSDVVVPSFSASLREAGTSRGVV